jgi:antitoxin PrlF
MTIATLTSKRQITLPADACAKLRLVKGSKVSVTVNEAGEIVLRPKTGDIRALKGFIRYDGPPVSLEDIDRGIADAVSERSRRGM